MNRIANDIPERIPIAISVRHVHLSRATIDQLFGVGYKLRILAPLVQPGQFATEDTVSLVGPHGRLAHVRVLGPPRAADQIEVSRSDEYALGLDAPVRISGDLSGTPGITIEGPAGSVQLKGGTICALRHIHMSPSDAVRLGVQDRDTVEVLSATASATPYSATSSYVFRRIIYWSCTSTRTRVTPPGYVPAIRHCCWGGAAVHRRAAQRMSVAWIVKKPCAQANLSGSRSDVLSRGTAIACRSIRSIFPSRFGA